MASPYKTNGIDFDDLFMPIGSATPGPDCGRRIAGVDLSQRYAPSEDPSDRIDADIPYSLAGANLRTFFKKKPTGPTITTQPANTTTIEGSATNLTVVASGSGTLTYQWQRFVVDTYVNVSGATSATYTIATTNRADQDYYRCIVTDIYGSTASAPAFLTVYYPPVITSHPSGGTLNVGDVANFSVSITEGYPLPATYQWQKNGVNVTGPKYSGATSASLSFIADASDNATFRCVVTNAAGSVNSSGAALVVNSPPDITSFSSYETDSGSYLTLTCAVVATGTAPLSYQWYKNGSSLGSSNGAQTATYQKPNSTSADSGTYKCVVTNALGSDEVEFYVAANDPAYPPVFDYGPLTQTVREGTAAIFSASATGTPTPTYQWQKNGADISGATGSTYTIPSTVKADEGSFRCVATNASGSVNSTSATLTVLRDPVITSGPGGPYTLNPGDVASFSITATGDGLSYQWKKDGADIPGANSATYIRGAVTSDAADGGSYTCTVSNFFASVTSSAAVLTVNP